MNSKKQNAMTNGRFALCLHFGAGHELMSFQARREIEASKLHTELRKKIDILESYADRLERHAGQRFCPSEDGEETSALKHKIRYKLIWIPDSAPHNIDDLYDELEIPSQAAQIIASVSVNEAGWLARYIREKSLRDQEAAAEEIDQELQVCSQAWPSSITANVTCRKHAQLETWRISELS